MPSIFYCIGYIALLQLHYGKINRQGHYEFDVFDLDMVKNVGIMRRHMGAVTLGQTLRILSISDTYSFSLLGLCQKISSKNLSKFRKFWDLDKKCHFFPHFQAKSKIFFSFFRLCPEFSILNQIF